MKKFMNRAIPADALSAPLVRSLFMPIILVDQPYLNIFRS